MTFKLQVVVGDDEHEEVICLDMAAIERGELSPETLGLRLDEGKAILGALQKIVVERQLAAHLENARACPACGNDRPIKGNHEAVLRTVFGKFIVLQTVETLVFQTRDPSGLRWAGEPLYTWEPHGLSHRDFLRSSPSLPPSVDYQVSV